jgi:hypothetical protein
VRPRRPHRGAPSQLPSSPDLLHLSLLPRVSSGQRLGGTGGGGDFGSARYGGSTGASCSGTARACDGGCATGLQQEDAGAAAPGMASLIATSSFAEGGGWLEAGCGGLVAMWAAPWPAASGSEAGCRTALHPSISGR